MLNESVQNWFQRPIPLKKMFKSQSLSRLTKDWNFSEHFVFESSSMDMDSIRKYIFAQIQQWYYEKAKDSLL